MKIKIAFVGLVLVLLSSNLWVYNKGLVTGKINYQRSKNMQLTLDAAYKYGVWDGEQFGYVEGLLYGQQNCKNTFKKLSKKERWVWCK